MPAKPARAIVRSIPPLAEYEYTPKGGKERKFELYSKEDWVAKYGVRVSSDAWLEFKLFQSNFMSDACGAQMDEYEMVKATPAVAGPVYKIQHKVFILMADVGDDRSASRSILKLPTWIQNGKNPQGRSTEATQCVYLDGFAIIQYFDIIDAANTTLPPNFINLSWIYGGNVHGNGRAIYEMICKIYPGVPIVLELEANAGKKHVDELRKTYAAWGFAPFSNVLPGSTWDEMGKQSMLLEPEFPEKNRRWGATTKNVTYDNAGEMYLNGDASMWYIKLFDDSEDAKDNTAMSDLYKRVYQVEPKDRKKYLQLLEGYTKLDLDEDIAQASKSIADAILASLY